MKLLEVIQSDRVPKTAFRHAGEELGTGDYGAASAHPRQQNVVVKSAYVKDPKTDGYLKFIRLVQEHQDNPFFPKIYKAKMIKHSKYEGYDLILTMERLHEANDPKISDAVVQNFERLGLPSNIAASTTKKGYESVTASRKWLEDSSNRQELAKNTPNPKFREALNILEPLLAGSNNDLHARNWMVRLTSSGPQLVVIDPVLPGYPYSHVPGF